ncbi:uncharacterized protein LOC127860600 [Dreissena polymorpha]|uniref:Uncharacterized protein n=1 Tax=Dreissena polymorpha TaxID=45954 RepID=A0A9D3YLX4_DREPO|nr:uncharacterized protein LOC127860600 [Dreissena polymorpha]KAH3701258.1 hypothetical protein DPMN_076241 [Dreissena polymorpha]
METKKAKTYNRDPFAVDPLPKAYYHPTPEKSLSKKQKSTSLYLKCDQEEELRIDDEEEVEQPISPSDEDFLKGGNSFLTRPIDWPIAAGNDGHSLDESWPASERPSSISITGLEDSELDLENYQSIVKRFTTTTGTNQERLRMPGTNKGTGIPDSKKACSSSKIPVKGSVQDGKKSQNSKRVPTNQGSNKGPAKTEVNQDGSVLKRYIERFRNSAPMSREERQQKSETGSRDFWWLSNKGAIPVDSFLEEETVGEKSLPRQPEEDLSGPAPALTRANLDKYKNLQKLADRMKFPHGVLESPGQKRDQELQDRAERLLEKSLSSTVSTEPAVSTEGLGSNMSDMSTLEEYSYRPRFAAYISPDPAPSRVPFPAPLPGQRPLPEDDPLQQWRLRRRIETAQHAAPKHVSPNFDFLSKTDQQRQIEAKLEEFKQRLAGKHLPSITSRQSENVQFTPTPKNNQQLHVTCQDSQGSHQPQIASPSLKQCRPPTDPLSEVDPHLHLMCDLLPCPHRGQYQTSWGNQSDNIKEKGTRNESKGTNSMGNQSEKFMGLETRDNLKEISSNEKQHENFKELGTRNIPLGRNSKLSPRTCDNVCDNNNDKQDLYKEKQYKQYLEAEKPDIESNKEPEKVRASEKDVIKNRHRDLENMVKEIRVDNDCDSVRERVDRENQTEKQNKQRENNNERQISKHDQEEDYPEEEKSKKMSKDNKPKKYGNSSGTNNEESNREKDACSETDSSKDRSIKPQHSSSPNLERRGVKSAIGQVIKEHLFSTSMSTVLSSVESLPPAVSLGKQQHQQQQQKQHPRQQPMQALEEDTDLYDSDGEFVDDELLTMLRRKRAMYEEQLRAIDKKLEELNR